MPLIDIKGVSKRFGGLAAVSDVDLSIDESEIHCLIGPNGAGKSTLFKLMVGVYQPTAGTSCSTAPTSPANGLMRASSAA